MRLCTKCGKGGRIIQRHHMGCEFMFSQILPAFYEKRYYEFREEDIVRICKRCHKAIHRIYTRRLGTWGFWKLLGLQDGKLTHVQAERFRSRLIQECHKWLGRRNGLLQRNALERTFSNSLESSRKQLKATLSAAPMRQKK